MLVNCLVVLYLSRKGKKDQIKGMGCTCSKGSALEHEAEEERLSEHIELTLVPVVAPSETEPPVEFDLLDQNDLKDSTSEEKELMEELMPNKALITSVEELSTGETTFIVGERKVEESNAEEKIRKVVMFDASSELDDENQKLDSEDETTEIQRETSTVYKTYGTEYKMCVDTPIPGYDFTDQSFTNSFRQLSQEDKLSILHSLLKEFDNISEKNESDHTCSVLYKLCLIILNERDPFGRIKGYPIMILVLRQFYLLMLQYHTVTSLLVTMYRYRTRSDYPLLATQLLVYYFVNSDKCDEDTELLISTGSIPVLVVILQYYSQKGEVIRGYISELLSLVYILCQHGFN